MDGFVIVKSRPVRRIVVLAALCVAFAAGAPRMQAAGLPPENVSAAPSAGMTRQQAYARAAALEALGSKLFFDPLLSASGRMSCASCHDPAHGFSPPNAHDVQFGGADVQAPGVRAVPALKYLQAVPQFTEHYFESEDEGDASIDNGPSGGLTWDGRVDRARDQARIPLLSPIEMGNAAPGDVVTRLRHAGYAGEIRALFGEGIFDDTPRAFAGIVEALEVYQQNPATFYPYTSRYDAFLAGRAQLTPQEQRGLAAFNDPARGNCGNCHRSKPGDDGTPPQFTDFGMIAIGLPRNRAIPANADQNFFDLGLCGPMRTDLAGRDEYCGLFRTPSLRNVALRKTFYHNGSIHSLRDAVSFYVERDTKPEKWYPRDAAGQVMKFDDLPEKYRDNLNVEPPFGPRAGNRPALDAQEIEDIVAFLGTLTDGYVPAAAQARPQDQAASRNVGSQP